MYNINEMVSVMGKRKKMPTTLGINLKTGTILIAPERAQDEPAQEWTADRMTHYSREGKHVFMELVRPSKSIDFHAGAKDTAEEIVGALGELAGAIRAEGLREVIMAGSQRNQRKGQVLYDFMAQGDDEVTVAAGDEVMILDESKSDEWWQVRRIKNGKEGVVPSSYIEAIGTAVPSPVATKISPTDSARSTVEQNRLEEIRLTKEAIKGSKELQQVRAGTATPGTWCTWCTVIIVNSSEVDARMVDATAISRPSRVSACGASDSHDALVARQAEKFQHRTRIVQGADVDRSIRILQRGGSVPGAERW